MSAAAVGGGVATRDALVRAAIYETLSLGYAYPTPDGFNRLRAVCCLAREEAGALGASLQALLDALVAAAAATDAASLAPRHTRLFTGEVACSPHETEYESDPFAKTRQLADIAGFYHAFGVEVSSVHRAMADFIGTQAEFMSLLCRKEARAESEGDDEGREIVADAQRAFLEAHIGRWVGVFCAELRRVVGHDPGDALYRALTDVLEAFVAIEVVRADARPVPLTRRMLSAGHAELPMCDPRVAGCAPWGGPE